MSYMARFGNAEVMFAAPDQRIPVELQVEFELLRIIERRPDREWIARLERKLAVAARPSPWSILRVTPGMERKVRKALGPKSSENPHGAGLTVYVPMERYRPAHTWRSRTRPLIPGCIFANLTNDVDIDTARANHAVREVMSIAGRQVKVRAIEIGSMVLAEAMGDYDTTWEAPKPAAGRKGRPPRHVWAKGQRVRIAEGPFAGAMAEIVKADRADRMEVFVMLFGRVTPIELDEDMLDERPA